MSTLQHLQDQPRYADEWGTLKESDGEASETVIERLKDIAPARGRYTIDLAFDDVYACPRLALRSREIATIAMLTLLGNAQPQLKVQIHHALDVGCTRTQIVGAILHVAGYVGFTAVLHSTTTAKEVFQERDALMNELNHA